MVVSLSRFEMVRVWSFPKQNAVVHPQLQQWIENL